MRDRAYSGVKSKVSKNIKVIEKVKRTGSPCKPAPGYDPTFFVEESLDNLKKKRRPISTYKASSSKLAPERVSNDVIA